MKVLLDARQGRKPSGIGHYVLSLLREYVEGDLVSVRPMAQWGQVRAMRRLGVRPWIPFPPGDPRPDRLPPADVVHGPNFHAPLHPTATRVATIHDLGFLHLPDCHPSGMPERLDGLIRRSLPHTSMFVCDSEWTRRDFIEHYGVDHGRTKVVHLGVSPRFQAEGPTGWRRRLRLPERYLLHVGVMVRRKDLATLMNSFELVAGEESDLHLVLAGDKSIRWASDWPRVETWLAEHPSLASRVHVLDYVPYEALPELYRAATAVVSTSLMEGFGLTVLEGLASATPVVATVGSAVSEVAGDVAFLGQPREPDSYADAIRAALIASEPRRIAGVQLASLFTWERAARATIEAYRQAVAGPPTLPAPA